MDTAAASYQNPATLERTVNKYIDQVAGYSGTGPQGWAGVRIDSGDISARNLDLVVPNLGTPAQQQAINQAVQNAASKGVTVNVIVRP